MSDEDTNSVDSTISSKELRLNELNESIEEEKQSIQQLNISISELQADILRFQNANKLFQYLKPSTIPEHVVDPDDDANVEFNEDHVNILKEKRNMIPPLRAEVASLEEEQTTSEDRLSALRTEYDSAQNQLVELQERIRFANSESLRSARELSYVQDQIKERDNEIKMMEDLKREAQAALSSLINRASDGDGIGGGRLDTEKAIVSLQNELRQVLNETEEIKQRIRRYEAEDLEDIRNKNEQKAHHDAAVNWAKEKQELQEEWRSLMQQIQIKKKSLKSNESKQYTQSSSTNRVIPLIKKWQGKKVPNVNVPENATIESMFQLLDQVKEEHDNGKRRSEQEIAELIVNNARLQEEVNRRRKALERTVTQFHADENAMTKKIEDIRDKASKEEEKLLKQIEATKIKMAQRQLLKKPGTSQPSTPKKA